MWLIVFGIFEQYTIHIGAGILIELIAGREDDQRYLAIAQHGQLVGLLHNAKLALVEGHLRVKERKGEGESSVNMKQKRANKIVHNWLFKYLWEM